ncbi:LOW QUALITY PROTEIN: huntingtin-like [Babylonia areolata]|uniref:LOW QUALITY PROTEIN: huntingtin-like n=1 Tax=Babylonia areolata TaxID=304850 RepID=UPI003FD32539
MATIEKLVKSFEGLKVFQPAGAGAEESTKKKDQPPSKKEKILHCNAVADCICAPNMRTIADFPKFLGIAVEAFLTLCDDAEADVRMVADECLNRTIKTLLETNLGRLQVELYKEIKKNGASRSLRAALWRFADMCHLIRPQKCRPYIVNLLPYIARICRREEEAVQETLSNSMPKICSALMAFANDSEVKALLKSFLTNLVSPSAVCRRMAASSLTLICQYSRTPLSFFTYLITVILELVLPVDKEHDVYSLLGVILCLRHVLPHLSPCLSPNFQGLKDSFGSRETEKEEGISTEQLLKILQLLLFHTEHPDHNVVTASLEALQQMLKHPHPTLLRILLTEGGVPRTYIFQADLQEADLRAESANDLPSMSDDTGLDEDLDTSDVGSRSTSMSGSDTAALTSDLDSVTHTDDTMGASSIEGGGTTIQIDDSEVVDTGVMVTGDSDYSNVEIGDLNEERSELSNLSHSSSVDTLLSIKSISPKRQPPPTTPEPSLPSSIPHDMNGNPQYQPSEPDEGDMSEGACSVVGTTPTGVKDTGQDLDIGSLVDREEQPLVYMLRVVCQRFLLRGEAGQLVHDRHVRVSLKSLALGCVASIFSLCPRLALYKLVPGDESSQDLSDVLLYASHPDHQLKGLTALAVGSLIHAVLVEGRGDFLFWCHMHGSPDNDTISIQHLLKTLVGILDDDSSVATRHSLTALQLCLPLLLDSCHGRLGLQLLLDLIKVKANPYWLVKVELLDILGSLNFKKISYLESISDDIQQGDHHFQGRMQLQQHYLQRVILPLLGDDDGRVRQAASAALNRLIPQLFFPMDNPQHDPIISAAKDESDSLLSPILYELSMEAPPLVQGLVAPYHFDVLQEVGPGLESSLSRVVHLLMHQLLVSQSRFMTSGCCRALCTLSEQYLVTPYASAWGCGPAKQLTSQDTSSTRVNLKRPPSRSLSSSSSMSLEELTAGIGGGPLPVILSLMLSTQATLDLPTHQDMLQLAGNLIAGSAYKSLRSADEMASITGMGEEGKWAAVTDRMLVPPIEQLLTHVARILNACTHVIEETVPGPPQVKPSLPSLPNAPSLSPVKRKVKGADKEPSSPAPTGPGADAKMPQKTPSKEPKDSEKEKSKKEGIGSFYNLPQYMKLYEVLKGAYSNYKISLDLSSSDKFCSFVRVTLDVLAQLLEIATLFDVGKYAEEILNYFKSTVILEPTSTVLCVQQLLKALFGTNLASQWECEQQNAGVTRPGKTTRLSASGKPGLYHNCMGQPYAQLTHSLLSSTYRTATSLDTDDPNSCLMWLKKRVERKVPAILKPSSKVDKAVIGSYIRLFEPLVIKALKQYTVTSCLQLQRQVLSLLTQLIQLRVNYCLLDSDMIFITFVLKQFEFIEEGQIRNSEVLMPHIFQFLVMLSYEKYHSKPIIDMPRIIHRCDGIMASGLRPDTHAIPALQPIVYDLFLLRGTARSDVSKELETQREVVVSMLLRLIHCHQALEMFVVILQQCHRESEERWKRMSRMVTDAVMPALVEQQVTVDSQPGLDILHRLFESVAPSVFRPVDILLKTLLAPPGSVESLQGVERWMCLVLALLRVLVSQSKEEAILSRLEEMGLHIHLTRGSHHPPHHHTLMTSSITEMLRNLSAEETLAWFLLQVVGKCAETLSREKVAVGASSYDTHFLLQQLTHFMLYITHMFQSGLFRRVATAAMGLLQNESPACFYSIGEINGTILALSTSCPMLTLHWCNVLILLNYHDRQFWSQIVHTPQSFKMVSQSLRGRQLDAPKRIVECCNLEMLRRGGLILFCDYVCENLSDAEHMTWLIINHVTDLIELSNESPVQDFISAIHRNPAASSLFIQAIHARGESVCRPSLVKKTLRCLDAIHPSQSGALVTVLMDKFLHNQQLAVSAMCDTIICRRLEGLLALSVEESSKQLPQEDLEKLLHFIKSNGLIRRHERLTSLLKKLQTMTCPSSQVSLTPERTHPLALTPLQVKDIEIDKEFFMSVAKEQCFSPCPRLRECAYLLQRLDYADILAITMTKEFNLAILEECVSLGAFRTLLRYSRDRDSDRLTSPAEPSLDPLFQAAQLTMFRHVNNVINHLPVPHQCLNFAPIVPPRLVQYMDRVDEVFTDHLWFDMNFSLAAAFAQYVVCIRRLPWEARVPAESQSDVCRFCVLLLEMVHWSIQHDSLPTSEQLQMCLECVACVLQDSALWAIIAQDDHATWVCSLVAGLHQLLASVLVLPGEKVSSPGQEDHADDHTGDDVTSLIQACDQMSELVHCLQTRLHPASTDPRRFPPFLASLIRNIIVGLARLPLVNTYARTPPIVWRLGWSPSPSGTHRTQLPPLPVEFLQEKDVLKEFVTRINTLGWTNRQQFEESWMSLLGVLNPASPTGHPLSPEEEVEQSQGMVIAVRAITALLLQAMFVPHAGNPANSQFEIRPRDKPLAFLTTRCGKKLSMIRGLIEQEVRNLCAVRPDRLTHHPYSSPRRRMDSIHYDLFEDNLEREFGTEDYSLGQISLESIWAVVGSLDPPLTESDTTDSLDSPQPDDVGRHAISRASSEGRERSVSLSGLDIHSCLQFLLELYGAWLHVDNSPKPPLMLINAVVKSMVCLSDLFMEREQFEFMLDTLLDVLRTHPTEDELVNQYLTVGLAKATAVVGVEASTAEKVSKMVEQGLRSNHLPTKVSALHAVLYLLEGGLSDVTRTLMPAITDFLLRHLAVVSQACIISQQFVITLWATSFYLLENFHEELKDTDFASRMMQLVTSTASGSEESVSTAVFLTIMKGTERLLLTDVLSRTDTEAIIKLSMDRLCLPNPQRALAALGLMFTCMYSGKSCDQYSPRPRDEPAFGGDGGMETLYQDPESLILAMERVTVLFDRIKKGYPYEARVITRLLPAFLADFFPAQDIMNKVIGEFLSSQQPYPHLIAKVVFQVFNNLHQQSQHTLVQEWVMLSLSNFTQRSPVAMATWSLTSFFLSASTNVWLKALFPHVLGRMGKLEVVDRRLFCLAALDFFRQLGEDMHRRSFLSTFQGVASSPDSPYHELLLCISELGTAVR